MDLREVAAQSSIRHPWEMSRFRFFGDLLRSRNTLVGNASVLDVGAGDGFVSAQLAEESSPDCEFTCWDVEYEENAAVVLGLESHANVSLQKERPDSRFDLIMALDVLEHVEEDLELLDTLVSENLSDDGLVLISVPAWQALYSQHDEELTHLRRYSSESLGTLLKRAGLQKIEGGGLFHSLLVPRAITKLKESLLSAKKDKNEGTTLSWNHGPLITRAVYSALRLDNAISRVVAKTPISLPGLSLWALCRVSK